LARSCHSLASPDPREILKPNWSCCVVRRHLTEDQVEALEIELSDALARTLDEIKD
jgi:hypothetical protein